MTLPIDPLKALKSWLLNMKTHAEIITVSLINGQTLILTEWDYSERDHNSFKGKILQDGSEVIVNLSAVAYIIKNGTIRVLNEQPSAIPDQLGLMPSDNALKASDLNPFSVSDRPVATLE